MVLIFSDSSDITFLPHGMVLLFAGTVGSILIDSANFCDIVGIMNIITQFK